MSSSEYLKKGFTIAMLAIGLTGIAPAAQAMSFTSVGLVQAAASVTSYNASGTPMSMAFPVLDAGQGYTYVITCYRPNLGICIGVATGQSVMASGDTLLLGSGGYYTFSATSITHL